MTASAQPVRSALSSDEEQFVHAALAGTPIVSIRDIVESITMSRISMASRWRCLTPAEIMNMRQQVTHAVEQLKKERA